MFVGCQINRWRLLNNLGSGAYACVYAAEDVKSGKKCALKVLLSKTFDDENLPLNPDMPEISKRMCRLKSLFTTNGGYMNVAPVNLKNAKNMTEEEISQKPHYREIALHLRVHDHPNVTRVLEILDSPFAMFIVLDYYPQDLFSAVVDQQIFRNNGQLLKHVFLQVCSAIWYCHAMGIYHCDLKPENILLDEENNAHVCDFGLVTSCAYLTPNVAVGSSYYMAPERISFSLSQQIILHEDDTITNTFLSRKADVWSLGIILINMACIRNPWTRAHCENDPTYKQFLREPQVLSKILPISDELYQILIETLPMDPRKRIEISELMARISVLHSFTIEGPLSKDVEVVDDTPYRDLVFKLLSQQRRTSDKYNNSLAGSKDSCMRESSSTIPKDNVSQFRERLRYLKIDLSSLR